MPLTFTRPLKRGNARNWPGVIVMDPDAPLPAAVWAQECYEAEWKLNPVNMLSVAFSRSARREMEIMGHEIEVQVAVRLYGRRAGIYRTEEARALTAYPEFKGWTQARIEAAMIGKRGEAARWVEQNLETIRRHLEPKRARAGARG
ncbi:MAG: hypothetical protein ACU0B9_07055 [Limimaricola soesokkakensis]|uniref:hypothetical protein n=1 Tax=Limimaricola soesokkakensis TaxID=1343159 RepID=UPI00405989E7